MGKAAIKAAVETRKQHGFDVSTKIEDKSWWAKISKLPAQQLDQAGLYRTGWYTQPGAVRRARLRNGRDRQARDDGRAGPLQFLGVVGRTADAAVARHGRIYGHGRSRPSLARLRRFDRLVLRQRAGACALCRPCAPHGLAHQQHHRHALCRRSGGDGLAARQRTAPRWQRRGDRAQRGCLLRLDRRYRHADPLA